MTLRGADGKYLGMFPRGAFQERASDGQILLALTGSDDCVGSLLDTCSSRYAARGYPAVTASLQ
jgi:hypothetical protein